MKFKIMFSISGNSCVENFMGVALNLMTAFGRMAILLY